MTLQPEQRGWHAGGPVRKLAADALRIGEDLVDALL
jgi:hypothetical protein